MKLFVWEWPDGAVGGYISARTLAEARSGHDRWQRFLSETGDEKIKLAHRIRAATPQEANAHWAGLSETPEEYWAAQDAALSTMG